MDCDAWCDELAQRLPELMWKLPFWPKNYLSQIPFNLFEMKPDWTPAMAIHEVQNHIHRLRQLPLDSERANYLSQKILQQIQVLVAISKKLPKNSSFLLDKKALTRQDYRLELEEHIYRLKLQKNALQRSALNSAYQPEIQQEIDKIEHQIHDLKNQLIKI